MQAIAKVFKNVKGDKAIWMIVCFLSIFSILAVYSATSDLAFESHAGDTWRFLKIQSVLICAGLFVTFVCYRIPYVSYAKLAPYFLLLAIPLLVYTLGFADDINSSRRWIGVPFTNLTFQTSDFAKLALIVYLAREISKKQETIKDFKGAFVPLILPIIIVCGLIAPADFSTAALLFLTCLIMMFIGRVHMKYIVLLILAGLVLFGLIYLLGSAFPELIRSETWASRISEWVNNPDGGYQLQRSKIAIAEGGLIGTGPGQSLQRFHLPAPYSDFIFAIICEEYGLLGGSAIIGLFLILLFRGMRLVTHSPKAFGAILAIGLILSLVIQAFANIAVCVHLVPATGLTLPLVSKGGTSLLFASMSFGIVLSVSRYIETYKVKAAKAAKENESNN